MQKRREKHVRISERTWSIWAGQWELQSSGMKSSSQTEERYNQANHCSCTWQFHAPALTAGARALAIWVFQSVPLQHAHWKQYLLSSLATENNRLVIAHLFTLCPMNWTIWNYALLDQVYCKPSLSQLYSICLWASVNLVYLLAPKRNSREKKILMFNFQKMHHYLLLSYPIGYAWESGRGN